MERLKDSIKILGILVEWHASKKGNEEFNCIKKNIVSNENDLQGRVKEVKKHKVELWLKIKKTKLMTPTSLRV